MKRIAIVGPESTGKTVLAEKLAKHFGAPLVPEYAREYISKLNRKYTYEDVLEIALKVKNQSVEIKLQNINSQLATHNSQLIFFDTELICIKIWLQFYNWKVPVWISESILENPFNLYLLMDIDLPWIHDEQRANPNDRAFLFQQFEKELEKNGATYLIISGKGDERFSKAKNFIENL